MKIFILAATAFATFSAVNAAAESSLHLRVHTKGGACTITKESQCDGQNWTGSTCCADSGYECRWSDDGQNVKRCQKKRGTNHHKAAEDNDAESTEDDWSSADSEATDDHSVDSEGSEIDSGSEDWYGSEGSEDTEDWSKSSGDSQLADGYSESSEIDSGSDDYSNFGSEGSEYFDSEGSVYSGDESYSSYDEGSGSEIEEVTIKHHRHHHHKRLTKGGCTITNESQCDGQNWTGSTCCADSSYECRWSDDGQNVKRCQKKRGSKL
ncbi:hypothetical protein DVH05_005635 [Phytophthora capsici]|uniref:CBP2 n=1 Tax=Phytophthora capsici TaxID=4784 RepID=A0A8E5JRZ3_PHYCP|nr:hypothetical protein DVH05_005635 [Phytophthora capsici]QVD38855.1 CBP2 [Phytophthora capsici]|eukprot:jgi/Phyca11/505339/fgenesh2_kg.PHYCAscaffold_12_\